MGDGKSQTMSTPASRSGVGSGQSNESRAGRSKSASIVEVVSRRIEAGEYAPGQRLPSNAQLCTEFGVSSMTVRRAVVALKERGLVSSTRGKGTFVRSLDIGNADFRLGSVDGDWLDGSTDMRLLSLTMAQADEKTAARLGVPLGERVSVPSSLGFVRKRTIDAPHRIRCLGPTSAFAGISATAHLPAVAS